jgi:amphiphysin
LLTHQYDIPAQWEQTYKALPGESENSSRAYYETPESPMQSLEGYMTMLGEVKETLFPILNSVDGKVVQPCMDMKKALEQVQKMVKKRHHKKMDYDRWTASVAPLWI